MIWVVGDSHSDVFNGNANINGLSYGDSLGDLHEYKNRIVGKHIGSFTAYNSLAKKQIIQTHLSSFDKNTDYLFLSFGEIDCRCHIGFHADQKLVDYENVVSNCVQKYFSLLTSFQTDGIKVGAWGVIASGLYDGIQGNGALSYKTSLHRNIITNLFNVELQKMCKQANVRFKCIFNKIIDPDFNTIPGYHFDNIHIMCKKTSQFIIEEFYDIL